MFLSATTFGNDFLSQLTKFKSGSIVTNTKIGLASAGIFSGLLAYYIPSVVQLWYTIGSIAIPGIIFLVIGSYYSSFKIEKHFAVLEILFASGVSLVWFFVKGVLPVTSAWNQLEPMIDGLSTALLIHTIGLFKIRKLRAND